MRVWVRAVDSRRVTFGYAIEHDDSGELLATAITSLLVLDADFDLTRLPAEIAALLPTTGDLVRL